MSPEENVKQNTAKIDTKNKPSKLEIGVLQYFSNLAVNRQKTLIDEHKLDFEKFATAVTAHRREAIDDDEIAIEKMLAQQAPSKAGEKLNLLENRYRASIERFAKRGVPPVMIAGHLSEVEQKNYPKRPKSWRFTPAMVSKFMKDNSIEILSK